LKRIFDRKISDKITIGYKPEEVMNWLSDVKIVDNFEYYYYPPGSKFPRESKRLTNQPTEEVLPFLDDHFSESPNFFVEVQQKVFKSGKREIIFRGISATGEISKIAVASFRKPIK